MTFSREIESFIKKFVVDLGEKNVGIFAGAGMSRNVGFVNWRDMLQEIAEDLDLKIDESTNLIALAQYHQNERGGRDGINRKILAEFSGKAEHTPNHDILACLPITTYWTTNYDSVIEDSLIKAKKVPDVKHLPEQLNITLPKRHAVVYKMHGDKSNPAKAVITKKDFETYRDTRDHFLTVLSGDLVAKTFLFIGISFTDPNLDYVLSRLNVQFGENGRDHYCFIKKQKKEETDDEEIFQYKRRKQELMINDLKRYKIQTLLIDDYSEINAVLKEIGNRFLKKTILISGHAETYGEWEPDEAKRFIHSLSKRLVQAEFRIVNGFGLGVGSAVINGALEAIDDAPEKCSEDQLIMKPLPQFKSGIREVWEQYSNRMISMAGIMIILFGNSTTKEGKLGNHPGVLREFNFAVDNGLIPIPIAATGGMAKQLSEEILKAPDKYYPDNQELVTLIKDLNSTIDQDEIIKKVINIVKQINR